MGCAVVHDHPGLMSDSFFAVAFPEGARFDLGLLEMALTPLLMLTVIIAAKKLKRPGGVVVSLPLVYPWIRFPLDFLRAPAIDSGDVRYFGLTPGQYACFAFFGFGLYMLQRMRRQEAAAGNGGEVRELPQKKARKA
jgi:phosphatidylglycerol---prolipoprotein diacylglyceryl transferase